MIWLEFTRHFVVVENVTNQ